VSAPTIEDIEKMIRALGYGTEEYHEAMAFYCMTLARSQWRLAELARARRVKREALDRAKIIAGDEVKR